MKKVIAILTTGLLIAVLTVGCGQKSSEPAPNGNLSSFTAQDIQGNTVTQDILANYDITMINIWTTWCGFCVQEMPELQEVSQNAPANVNVITICVDAADEAELAKHILADSGATFTTLIGNKELGDKLTNYVSGYPTTVFVDSKGNLVGKAISGAPGRPGQITDGYLKFIDENLQLVGA